jgi:branched-chain amino acid transport system ATP-binding protein/nonpolar-amino-acid-transporting ATPase
VLARPLLAVDGVGHAFGGFRVLSGVGFDVPRGDLVGLMGPNGSGKTTLFNIICGFLHPRSGAVLLDGRPLGARSVVQRSRMGLVRTFQTPKVFEHLSVLENVMVGLYKESQGGVLASMFRLPLAGREVLRMRERAAATCEAFGLGSAKQQRAGALTAGARRNVELARAVVSEPRLLLLDEPSSGLSKEEVDHLREHLVRINRTGLTILLVSHDMDLMSVVSRVHVLSAGEIIASGTFDEMQRNTQVQQVYLGL